MDDLVLYWRLAFSLLVLIFVGFLFSWLSSRKSKLLGACPVPVRAAAEKLIGCGSLINLTANTIGPDTVYELSFDIHRVLCAAAIDAAGNLLSLRMWLQIGTGDDRQHLRLKINPDGSVIATKIQQSEPAAPWQETEGLRASELRETR